MVMGGNAWSRWMEQWWALMDVRPPFSVYAILERPAEAVLVVVVVVVVVLMLWVPDARWGKRGRVVTRRQWEMSRCVRLGQSGRVVVLCDAVRRRATSASATGERERQRWVRFGKRGAMRRSLGSR